MKITNYLFLLITLLFLGGCSSFMTQEKVDESYSQKVESIQFKWVQPFNVIPIKITRPRDGGGMFGGAPQEKIGEIANTMKQELPGLFKWLLSKKRITFIEPSDVSKADATLTVMPLTGYTECTQLLCQHSLNVLVELADTKSSKTVWSARFKVGAPAPSSFSREDLEIFSKHVVERLSTNNLLGTRR